MTSIAMQLGLAPLPAKTVKGRPHRADGSTPERKQNKVGVLSRAERTAERRARILHLIDRDGPATYSDIRESLGIPAAKDTIRLDLAELAAEGKLRMEPRGQAFVYHMTERSA